MCGRYRLTAKERYLRDHFGLDDDPQWEPRWNIAPTQQVAVVCQKPREPRRAFSQMRWGLIPSWAKDASIASHTINGMSETVADKPAFKESLRRRRCLIPAEGFYEWQRLGPGRKRPYHLGLADDSLFAFAGLWDRWRDPATNTSIETCTILTTKPNALVADVHDRMPVILRPEDYDLWLDPGATDPAKVAHLLTPLNAQLMRKYPVSHFVNRAENDGPECACEISLTATAQPGLF
ncbi:MAG TPA: SOS response-associated peptidase [Terriglobales bacterium]|nr:SOS response-associated peptidase [Terriglobales bacterium]